MEYGIIASLKKFKVGLKNGSSLHMFLSTLRQLFQYFL